MEEIAKGYGLSWRAKKEDIGGIDQLAAAVNEDSSEKAVKDAQTDSSEKPSATKPSDVLPGSQTSPPTKSAQRQEQDDLDALRARFESLKKR